MWKACKVAVATTLLALAMPSQACTIIAAGKNATSDGSAMIAHTDDAGGGASDIRVIRVPAMDHKNGSQRAVYNFFGGYPRVVTDERGPQYQPHDKTQSLSKPIGFIPQVEHTYAYFDQDYGMANEVQLSIVESTCGAKTVGWALDVPYGNNLFGIAELSKIALERCDSARCAIQTMGDLATKYGFYSEDSGDPAKPGYGDSAETVGIADKYGEVWIFHVLTGPANASAVWAAQRLRDDHVTVVANSFTIRQMDLSNADYYMASSNVHSFAQEMKWWNPKEGPFDFTAAYGYHDFNPIRPLYTGRRVWRVLDVVAPSLQLDPRLGCVSQYETYPFSVQPDELVTVQTVMNLLRDYYQGTPFDMSKGIAAGPFNAPIRWDGSNKGVIGGWERPISMFRTMFSFILQTRPSEHDGAGCIVWYGQSTPHATVYVPFSCRQTEIPASYTTGKQSEFNQESAWWAFDFVKNWSLLRFDSINIDIQAKINQLQTEAFALRKQIDEHVLTLNTSTEIDAYIQSQSNAFASKVVKEWWSFAWQLVSKFSDGYITTGETPDKMKTLGYPKWWLEMSEFSKWPGASFTPQESILKEMEPFWNLGDSNKTATIASTSTPEKPSTSMNFIQLGGGLLCGVLIGATAVYFHERSRRKGYNSIQ